MFSSFSSFSAGAYSMGELSISDMMCKIQEGVQLPSQSVYTMLHFCKLQHTSTEVHSWQLTSRIWMSKLGMDILDSLPKYCTCLRPAADAVQQSNQRAWEGKLCHILHRNCHLLCEPVHAVALTILYVVDNIL